MGVTLINGDGNSAVYASQDADWFASMTGQQTTILDVNQNLAHEVVDDNHIVIKSGVLVTKEGRRVQIDVGETVNIVIPSGTQNVTRYYIIGFKLKTDGNGNQTAEGFCQLMDSATATIDEDMFKEGATTIYVSLYRVTQVGLSIDTVSPLLVVRRQGLTKRAVTDIIDLIYPVGQIVVTTNSANPSTYWGGTWVAWGSGRVPVGVNTSDADFDTVEETGGEKTHTLTVNEMPEHEHTYNKTYPNTPTDYQSGESTVYTVQSEEGYATTKTGGNQPHNNLQPYITCYMWKRTA